MTNDARAELRLPKELKKAAQEQAKKERRSFNMIVILALEAYLKARK